jgi:protein phosphatase
MLLEYCGRTDRGATRDDNEDRILVEGSLGLFVVCDGMGGRQRGEIAAEKAIAAVRFYIDASNDRYDVSWPFGYAFDLSLDANRLVTGIRLANRQVWRHAEQSLECAGMGTTIAAVLLHEGRMVTGNAGDSRVYLWRSGGLTQLSVDDTMVSSMVQKGMLSRAEAAVHPMRNVVTQAIGSQESVETHLQETALENGDVVLLSSDGLHATIGETAIQETLAGGAAVEQMVDQLIAAALAAGAPDNVSAIVVRYS